MKARQSPMEVHAQTLGEKIMTSKDTTKEEKGDFEKIEIMDIELIPGQST